MTAATETGRSVSGAWRLAIGDRNGLLLFTTSPDGFWRSFRAAWLLFPIYAFIRGQDFATGGEAFPLTAYAMAETISYVIKWVAFPLIAIYLLELLGRSERYFAYLTVYNWASVIQLGAFFIALLLQPLLPGPLGSMLMMMVTFAVLIYQGYIAWLVLEIPLTQAVALVLIDILLSIFISIATSKVATGQLFG